MKKHVIAVHEKAKPFKCEDCNKEFSKKLSYTVHMRSACGTKSKCFKCDICGNKFTTNASRVIHMNAVHKGLKPYMSFMPNNFCLPKSCQATYK